MLAGDEGTRDTVTFLAYTVLLRLPSIAPEDPGDLFDGTEIDEILTLRILTMTDEERKVAGPIRGRVSFSIEPKRCRLKSFIRRLHGVLRPASVLARRQFVDEWEWQLLEDKTPLEHVWVGGAAVRPGDRVELKPRQGGDIFDLALASRVATIESIEQDYKRGRSAWPWWWTTIPAAISEGCANPATCSSSLPKKSCLWPRGVINERPRSSRWNWQYFPR